MENVDVEDVENKAEAKQEEDDDADALGEDEDEEDPIDAPIEMLPNEVLGHIFDLLEFHPSLASVSRHWRDVYDDYYVLQPRSDGYYSFPGLYTTDFFDSIERRYERRKAVVPGGKVAKDLLEFAIARGKSKLVQLLLEDDTKATFDVEESNGEIDSGSTALSKACITNRPEILEMLLADKRGRFDPSYMMNQPLRFACVRGHLECAEILLNDSRVDPRNLGLITCLFGAANQGTLEIIKLFLQDSRIDLFVENGTILNWARLSGNAGIYRLLAQEAKRRSTTTTTAKR